MDQLDGTEEYGNPEDNKVAWAKKFEGIDFKKVKICSGEKFKNPYSREYTKEEIVGKLSSDPFLADNEKIKSMGGADIFISPLDKYRYDPKLKYALSEECWSKDNFDDILNHNSRQT